MSDRLSGWLDRNSLYIALLAAWIAMCGSLYFSEVAGYVPCKLCWYQRILMYPLTLVIAIGLIRRVQALPWLVLPFSIIGMGVALYHYLLEKTDLFINSTTCDVGAPCTVAWINWLGFITIPFLALIAFMIITLMSIIAWQAGAPDPEDESARPLLPVSIIVVVVVVVFVVLGQINSPVAHAETSTSSAFTVIETGAAMGVDAPAVDTITDEQAMLVLGQQAYEQKCAMCHGVQAEGIQGLGSALKQSEVVQSSPVDAIVRIVREGVAVDDEANQSGITMPPNGGHADLTDADVIAIVQYLRSL